MEKRLLYPQRLRRLPPQFSWIDQRLVREQHIDRLSHGAAALYLFLCTVADKNGLSYYSDRSLARRLQMPAMQLDSARAELVEADLIAYQAPLYQLLLYILKIEVNLWKYSRAVKNYRVDKRITS